MAEYKRPGWLMSRLVNGIISLAARRGISLGGAHMLSVRGRQSGRQRTTPVNPLTFNGQRYLVAPRGETHWVRNIRAAGEGELRLGRKREAIRASEVPDGEKGPILKAYLDRWAGVTASHFGVSKKPTDEEIARVAPRSPVFRIEQG